MEKKNKPEINIGGFYLITQCTLLVLHYGGFVVGLPNFVIWFPTLLKLITLLFVVLITLLVFIISLFGE